MRIVLDTNILARATPGKSGPAAAVRTAIRPPHLLIASPYLLAELAQALRYERLRRLHGLTDPEIDQFVAALQQDAVMIDVAYPQGQVIVPSDPNDDPIVNTAVLGQADFLCSNDKHLFQPQVQAYCAAHRVQVVTDVELLVALRTP